MKRSKKQRIIRILKTVSKKTALITAINLGICGIVWWIAGLGTLKDYGSLLVAISFVYILMGFGGFQGIYKRRADLTQKITLSAMGVSMERQNKQELDDTDKSLKFTIWSWAVSFFTMIIGVILFSV